MLISAIVVLAQMTAAATGAELLTSITPLVAAGCAVSVMVFVVSSGQLRTRMVPDLVGQLPKHAAAATAGCAVPLLIVAAISDQPTPFRGFVGLAVLFFVWSTAADFLSVVLVRRLWAAGWLRSRGLLLGSGRLSDELAVELEIRREYGVDLVDRIRTADDPNLRELTLDRLAAAMADRVIVTDFEGQYASEALVVQTVRALVDHGVPVFVVPRLHQLGLGFDSMSPDRARGYPLVRVQRSAHPQIARRVKRAIDMAGATLLLIPLSPLLVVTALAILITDGRPVLFRQPRVGQRGVVFDMLKFRTMRSASNEHAERSSEHRVTGLGRFLRASSIDELPQLVNIARGDMSFVGPRPERIAFVEEGIRLYPDYADRHRAPMGLTGLAQVAGLRGEDTSLQERIKFDNLYVDQWSLWLDLQILLKTVFAIVLQGRYRRHQRELSAAISEKANSTQLTIDLTVEPAEARRAER